MTDNSKAALMVDPNNSEDNEEIKQSTERQDAFVVFANEKDLRHHEAIRIKASLYTGIALRVKLISPAAMENLLYAIDLDSGLVARKKQEAKEAKEAEMKKDGQLASPKSNRTNKEEEKKGGKMPAANANQQSSSALSLVNLKPGIVNLRFEECKFTRKAAAILSEWLKTKALIETICLLKVSFEDIIDFKKITEGMKLNQKLLKLSFQYMNFDEEVHGTSIGRVLSDSRSIRELDITHIVFDYRTFYDMCQAILNERCRLNILKMRGVLIGEIEGKIIQFILMKNKQIHTLDLSECKTEDATNFDYFVEKMNSFCNIRYLTMEKMQPDLSNNIETLGESLADNTKLEVLILRDNRIKWNHYQAFWTSVMPNRTLQKLNLQKTDMTDRVVEKLTKYIEQEDIQLADLDLSKNAITDAGIKLIATALIKNRSIMYLNMGQNKIKEEGMNEVVDLLKVNTVLTEMSFGGNIISNEGVAILAQFLPHNNTLSHLDLSRNAFNDTGFDMFAEQLAFNDGLTFLDIAKNKEVTDEGSLVTFCEAMTINKKLKTIDLTGLSIRKPFLKQNFDQALKRNITLQEVIGKIPSNIINSELEQNIIIEKEILPLYQPNFRAGRDHFNLALVEDNPENHSRLNLKEQPQRLIKAAFKLIRNYDIRSVDFTGSGIHDDSLRMLSLYLRSNPNLRSVVLDKNLFTDDGLMKLTTELNKNTKLAHLSIKGCTNVTNNGLQKLCDVISTTNTCLFQVDLDVDQFEKELATEVITESALNRDIQEKLKPVKITTVYDQQGNIIKVNSGADRQEVVLSSDDDESDSEGEKVAAEPQVATSALSRDNASRTSVQSQGNTEATDASVQLKTLKKPEEGPTSQLGSKQSKLRQQEQAQRELEETFKYIVEVQFDGNAKIGDCFQSALKAWRIYSPNVIKAEDQNLTDEHIEELCNFLENREMISKLNLRRNFISNQGAKSLGKFISDFDETLTHLDITRNRIGQDGGKAILDALNATTRIVDCQFKYGNPISSKMGRIIEREIKANIQAVSYTNSHKENALKYELIDKGPDFMRCAIKMAQLHNILHLSLPDNMLALEDASMIADLIKKNTPLRKLNLSTNQLDADCAALIANSLIYNTNLQLLNISKNMLGDLGVYLLLTPLIRKHLQAQDFVSKVTPTISDKDLLKGKNVKASKRIFKPIEIETQLQYLDLEQNMTTWEVYKQIWLVLVANQDLSIKIDDPPTMKNRDNSSIFSSPQYQPVPDSNTTVETVTDKAAAGSNQVAPIPGSGKKVAPDTTTDDAKALLLLNGPNTGKSDLSLVNQSSKGLQADHSSDINASQEKEEESEELDEEQLIELERKAMIKEKERIKAEKERKAFEKTRKRKICCQKVCCFKDYDDEFDLEEKLPSYTQICCWRFLKARRQSTQFYMGRETLTMMEQSKKTVCISLLISFNYLVLYTVVIVPFILISLQEEVVEVTIDGQVVTCEDDQEACDEKIDENRVNFNNFVLMVNAGVLVYFLLCELFVVCTSLTPTNTSCNSYLLCQLITGLTSRAVILISAQLIAVFIQDLDVVNFVLGIVICSTLVLSQLRVIQIWLSSIKKDQNNLLPKVKQNFNICMSTNYLAAATLYKKVCVEASDAAIEQTDALMAERSRLMSFSFADDDAKSSKKNVNVKAKLAKSCKCCRWTSPKFYQLIMNDIPLIFCLPFAYIFGLMDTVNAAVGVVLTLLDLVFMLFYLGYDEELSIDGKRVHEMTQKRLDNREYDNNRLFADDFSIHEVSEEERPGSSPRDQEENENLPDQMNENFENEVLLTESKHGGGPNSNSDTVNFDGTGTSHPPMLSSDQKQGNELSDEMPVSDVASANRKEPSLLPPIGSETQNDRSNYQTSLV